MENLEEKDPLKAELRRRREENNIRDTMAYFRLKHRRKKGYFAIATILLVSIIAVFALFYTDHSSFPFLALAGTGIGFTAFALAYLQPTSIARNELNEPKEFYKIRYYIDKQLKQFQDVINTKSKNFEYSGEEKASVLASIQAKLESEALQSYLKGIEELVRSNITEETLDERFQQTRRRLGQEIQDLAKRGNLNLILGILTTVSGLSVLSYAVFTPPQVQAVPQLLSYFVPRVSLVILIEVFAYFFLSLYKQSLSEIKYFQNELTNIEAKQLALQLTVTANDSTLRTELVQQLVKTERNFILNKDQTTVDLEREKISQSHYNQISEVLKEVVKNKKNNS